MFTRTLKITALAAVTALGLAATQAQAEPTGEVALFLTIKTLPGQRDALVSLWDAHLKDRATEDANHVSYIFALDMMDADTVHISEVYATQAAFEANTQSAWFAAYMSKAGALLAGEPAFAMASPHWVK